VFFKRKKRGEGGVFAKGSGGRKSARPIKRSLGKEPSVFEAEGGKRERSKRENEPEGPLVIGSNHSKGGGSVRVEHLLSGERHAETQI